MPSETPSEWSAVKLRPARDVPSKAEATNADNGAGPYAVKLRSAPKPEDYLGAEMTPPREEEESRRRPEAAADKSCSEYEAVRARLKKVAN